MSNPTELPGRSVLVLTLPEAPFATEACTKPAPPVEALYTPHPSDAWVPPLNLAMRLAREDLAAQQGANIHDRDAMVRAAVTLEIRLRQLLGALDAESAGGVA